MKMVTKEEALRKNLILFYVKPCKYGHTSGRYTNSNRCKTCLLELIKRSKDKRDAWRKKNRKKLTEQSKKSRERRIDVVKAKDREYYHKNKEKARKSQKLWAKNNPEKRNFINAKWRAQRKKALPKWADLQKIREIYLNCPQGHEVDHIIPLNNKRVCGLHNEFNLQYLTKEENCSKGNKFMT